ncbi:MAG: penicillin-binding protein [Candidatus Cryptobacteroides sp.]
MENGNNINNEDHRISRILWFIYLLFLVLSAVLIIRIVQLQVIWEPDSRYVNYFRPSVEKKILEPERGAILDCNGKLLAISTPLYDLRMDCTIQKSYFNTFSAKERDSLETLFRSKLKLMCKGLAEILQEEGKDGNYYYRTIISNRESDKAGRRNLLLAKDLDHSTLVRIDQLPLAKEGRYKSGLKKDKHMTRQYPYGDLAGRLIGDITVDKDNPERNRFVGVEGQYDYILHGKEGVEWMKRTDHGRIADPDSTSVRVEDGLDIRTTINIDMQDIADRALRKQLEADEGIEGGCVVVMDVKTGAIKSMVNLSRNKKGKIGEYFNMAVGRAGEPGSVFKAVTLSILLEDGKVGLDTEIETNGGMMKDMKKIPRDESIVRYERNTGKKTISVLDGFKKSSNYVFRTLVMDNYRNQAKDYVSRLYEYKLNDSYKFDLFEKGGTVSSLPDPESKGWTITDLASIAIGYTVKETPLNIAMFYNAIANNGKMMKPYLIDAQMDEGKVVKRYKPEILNGSLFSKATADTLTRALTMVTLEGTASRLKNAKCVVAGKTGTARLVLPKEVRGGSKDPYKTIDGYRKFQATFVGFFPADEPKYTAIVTIYTNLTRSESYGGGNIPAKVYKEIVDDLWSLDSGWGNELAETGKVPQMKGEYIGTGEYSGGGIPNLIGMGLKDAIYAIENNGYRCSYKGIGHVYRQTPQAGTKAGKGETVEIELR